MLIFVMPYTEAPIVIVTFFSFVLSLSTEKLVKFPTTFCRATNKFETAVYFVATQKQTIFCLLQCNLYILYCPIQMQLLHLIARNCYDAVPLWCRKATFLAHLKV